MSCTRKKGSSGDGGDCRSQMDYDIFACSILAPASGSRQPRSRSGWNLVSAMLFARWERDDHAHRSHFLLKLLPEARSRVRGIGLCHHPPRCLHAPRDLFNGGAKFLEYWRRWKGKWHSRLDFADVEFSPQCAAKSFSPFLGAGLVMRTQYESRGRGTTDGDALPASVGIEREGLRPQRMQAGDTTMPLRASAECTESSSCGMRQSATVYQFSLEA